MRSLIPLALLLVASFSLTWIALHDDPGTEQASRREEPAPRITVPPRPSYPPGEVQVERHGDCVRYLDMRLGVMGTRFVVEVAAPDPETARRACASAYRRIHDLELALSTWRDDSLLSRLNREPADTWVAVDPETDLLLREARRVFVLTGGAFDPTVGPLVSLWREAGRSGRLPDADALRAAAERVGFDDRVRLATDGSRRVRLLREGVALDLGGIAKGFAADVAAWAAVRHGATACRVNAGGDQGTAVGAPPWAPEGFPVRVRDPEGAEADGLPGFAFPLRGRGVATSGNYERFVTIGEQRYSHILDPRTGRPVENPVVQVTVLAATGTLADGLATGLVVAGREEGLALAESIPGVEALFVTRSGPDLEFHRTSGFPGGPR
jgi:thiamine biosynthesis lipoprotein